ncbi:hypothetical protein [Histidinibacterium lentulum]|uniref:Uncharacterized protein n=1 Tax=Histidinibacterium lentulum TaxID=2480588 RepID=A0A3N2R601_9RHOB|nr:hypothetical protein [Histidinibacterium lentulum]ROU02786.1 hypothetical protein EAT49_10765 [Histidinibacterium lentulum]
MTEALHVPAEFLGNKQTKSDLDAILKALSDDKTRRIAEVALSLTAQIVERDEDAEGDLTDAEQEALALSGIDTSSEMSREDFYASEPVKEGLSGLARMTGEAIPLAEAASLMGVGDSRLRQRISDGSLVAIPRPRGRGWLIPAFQLSERGELPYLSKVLKAARTRLSAREYDRLFRAPQDDLEGMSIRDWLLGGGDPERAAFIVASQ